MTGWSVCSMVAEPPALLAAFAAHYLELGADEVHLYLDAPDDETIDLLSPMKGVRLTLCTPSFWRGVDGKRPPGQVMRQLKIANQAYRQCRSDWFFFCDADEFAVSRGSLADALARQPGEVRFCRPAMAERIFEAGQPQADLFDGLYRGMLPPRPALARQVYGTLAPMLHRGLTGHVLGKSFVRTGQDDLRIRIHFPVPFDGKEETRRKAEGTLMPGPFLPDSWLVHFDGMTPLHWKLKLLRYYLSYAPQLAAGDKVVFRHRTPARSQQLVEMYESRGDRTAMERMVGLIRLTPATCARLDAIGGLLRDIALDPGATARRRVDPGLTFSAAEFDARLMAKHAQLIAEHGLAD